MNTCVRSIRWAGALLLLFSVIGAQPLARAQDAVGSITLTFYACPADMNRDTLDPDQCALITEGFDVQITYGAGTEFVTLAEAATDGTSFTWSSLPAAPTPFGDLGDPYSYHFEETILPAGYADYIVDGIRGDAPYDELETYFHTRLLADEPDISLAVYNFVEAPPAVEPATVTITAWMCPATFTGGDFPDQCGSYPVSGAWFRAGRAGEARLMAHVFGMEQADETGSVTFTPVRSALRGAIYVMEDLQSYYRYDQFIQMDNIDDVVLSCSTADGSPLETPVVSFQQDLSVIVEIPVEPGAVIACDWYNINSGLWSHSGQPFFAEAFAIGCATDPGSAYPYPGPFPPEGCETLAGVGISVVEENGTPLDACVTDDAGRCLLALPANVYLVITEDEDSLPAGYSPLVNSRTRRFSSELVPPVFINLDSRGMTPTTTATVDITTTATATATLMSPAPTPTPEAAIEPSATRGAVVEPTESPIPEQARPAHIHPGRCGALDQGDRIELEPLILGDGAIATTAIAVATLDATPGAMAVAAELSVSVIDMPLADLLASPHAINVHAGVTEMRAYLVCGAIGGPEREDGSIAIGLREERGSGYEGIAYLAPNPEDPEQTLVWVFIAPALAEEEQTTPMAEIGTPEATPADR